MYLSKKRRDFHVEWLKAGHLNWRQPPKTAQTGGPYPGAGIRKAGAYGIVHDARNLRQNRTGTLQHQGQCPDGAEENLQRRKLRCLF